MNLVAFYTYRIKFPDLRLVPFVAYTYNIQGRHDGTMRSSDNAGARHERKEF